MLPRTVGRLSVAIFCACLFAGTTTASAAVPNVAWQRIAIGGDAPDRVFHSMIYDSVNEQFVVFGGIEADAGSNRFRNHVFTLDATDPDARWQRVVLSGLQPQPLALHTALYDSLRQRMIVYGGLTDRNGFSGQQVANGNTIWYFDLSDPDSYAWSFENVVGNPINRFAHAAAYVPQFDAMVISGGAEAFNDLTSSSYALLLGENPRRWVRLANAGFNLRAGHTMFYDGGSRLFAYGGLTNFQQPNPTSELVQLNIAGGLTSADRWTRVTTSTPGLPRAFFASTFDVEAGLLWVHGGFQTQTTILNDLSVLDLAGSRPSWTRTLVVINGPGTRLGHAAALDPSRSRAVFQGGSPDNSNTRNDTYALNMESLGPTSTPSPTTDATSTSTSTATATSDTSPTPTSSATSSPTPTATETPPDGTVTATASASATDAVTATPSTTPTDSPPVDHEVDIVEFAFDPDPIEILVGETVRWQNRDSVPHTTTSGSPNNPDGQWDSPFMNVNEYFDHTFTSVGSYPYYCRVHPNMTGTVIVTDGDSTSVIYLPMTMKRDDSLSPPTKTPTQPPEATPTYGATPPTEPPPPTTEFTETPTPSPSPTATPPPIVAAEIVSQLGGEAETVTVRDSLVYLGMGPRMLILDAGDAEAPALLGQSEVLAGTVSHIALDGSLAFVAHTTGIAIFDVSDPGQPQRVGEDIQVSRPRQIALRDGLAYVAFAGGLGIYDVSDLAAPTPIGLLTAGFTHGVTLSGDLALLARNQGLLIADVSDPANPLARGALDTTSAANRVAVEGAIAYIANDRDGLRIVDVSDPDTPVELALIATPIEARAVLVADGLAFVATNFGGLTIVDVTQAAAPTPLGAFESPGRLTSEIDKAGDLVFLADGGGGLRIVNVADPAQPQAAGDFDSPGRATALAFEGGKAYVGYIFEGLQILDVTDPASPAELSYLDEVQRSEGLFVTGSRLYVAQGNTFNIFDVANPAAPAELGAVNYPLYASDVRVVGTTAYVAELFGGLGTWNVANPAAPTQLGAFESPGTTSSLEVVQGRVYLPDGDGGLQIIDATNPAAPTVVGNLGLPADAEAVAVAGNIAYVAGSGPHLQAVDVTNPAAPQALGSLDGRNGFAIALQGSVAYIAHSNGLQIVDISDPAAPEELLNVSLPGRQFGVAVAGDIVYLAGDAGFFALRVTFP